MLASWIMELCNARQQTPAAVLGQFDVSSPPLKLKVSWASPRCIALATRANIKEMEGGGKAQNI